MPILPHATPTDLDLDADKIQVAYDLLQEWTSGDDAPVPGGAILVGRHGKTLEQKF